MDKDVDGRAWTGLAAAAVAVAAGIGAAVTGAFLVGALAALAGAGCGGVVVLTARRSTAEQARAASEARAREQEILAAAEATEQAAAELVARQRAAVSVVDSDSGLLDQRVFAVTLERRLAAARHSLRPLSLVLLDVAPGLPEDGADRQQALARWGSVLRKTLRDSDTPCRIADSIFGILLEDTHETGGVWAAERLQIAASFTGNPVLGPVRASVATYPTHGLEAAELLNRAWEALARAQARNPDDHRLSHVELPSTDL